MSGVVVRHSDVCDCVDRHAIGNGIRVIEAREMEDWDTADFIRGYKYECDE